MKKFSISILILILAFVYSAGAKNYKAAIAELPNTDYFVKLLKGIGEETNNTFEVEVVPKSRSIYLIEAKQVDLQCPQVEVPNPKMISDAKYDFSTTVTFNVAMVLYTNKKKPISVEELKAGNQKKYLIETETANASYFNFPISPSRSIEASLQKVNSGMIDGYIYTQSSTDKILKTLALKDVKRQKYDFYPSKFTLQKGAKGGELDKVLTDGINKMKANGKYDAIMGGLVKSGEYVDWQP